MYNPEIHHRRSIRLQGYNYSQSGLYFVTICTKEHILLFGNIHADIMLLNEAGKIAKHEMEKTPKHRKNILLHEYTVMPNHVHFIIEITNDNMDCNEPLNDCRGVACYALAGYDANEGVARYAPTTTGCDDNKSVAFARAENNNIMSKISPKPRTLSSIVRAYKSAVSKQLGYSPWQRNYHENIIRNEQSYCKITEYIKNNSQTWEKDKFYKEA